MGVTVVDICFDQVDIYSIQKGTTRKAELPARFDSPERAVDFAEAVGQAMEAAIEHVGDTGLIAIDVTHPWNRGAICAAVAAAPSLWSEVGYLYYNAREDPDKVTEEGDERGKRLHDHYLRTLAEQNG